jgi:N-methylhydantoinase A
LSTPPAELRIGVDVGGTFTDFVVADPGGSVTLWKEPTTPADPGRAVRTGLAAVAAVRGVDTARLLGATRLFVHGTTIATNQVIERTGPTVGLLATRGFRDVLELRDGYKPDRYNLRLAPPRPLVDRHLRIGVTERVDRDGTVVTPLDEADVRRAAAQFAEHGVDAIAVAFLWSFRNPAHEERAAAILAQELPGVPVLRSAAVLPELREWPRTSSAVLSAYILPAVAGYLRRLEADLREAGLATPLCVMQLNGGSATVEEILARPVYALHSGPAAAPAAAIHYGRRLGLGNVISVDLGGTSFDVAVLRDGAATTTHAMTVDGNPVGVPALEVHTVGAGGGSIAAVDRGGALHVGPRSAGSVPGPAAYGSGGGEPTVTDAHVVLGHLDPDAFLGGRRALRADLAAEAINRHVAEPLGLELLDAAAGIIRVVDTSMVTAIRAMSVERGIDPRGFALLCGGGAGALHAGALARLLGITTVVIPREAGTLCAFGMTVTDVVHDVARAHHTLASVVAPVQIAAVFDDLALQARTALRRQGLHDSAIAIERSIDVRYPGQVHEIVITLRGDGVHLDAVAADFHAAHARQFGYSRPELDLELLHCRVRGIGRTPPAGDQGPAVVADRAAVPVGERAVYDPALRALTTVPRYDGDAVAVGSRIAGPALVSSATTTILVADGDVLTAPRADVFVLEVRR